MIATGNETGRRGHPAALGATGWLSLAAAPTFATMALLTGIHGEGMPDMLCSATQDASPLSGMVLMYLLMSAFHSAPWLKLISRAIVQRLYRPSWESGAGLRWSNLHEELGSSGRAMPLKDRLDRR